MGSRLDVAVQGQVARWEAMWAEPGQEGGRLWESTRAGVEPWPPRPSEADRRQPHPGRRSRAAGSCHSCRRPARQGVAAVPSSLGLVTVPPRTVPVLCQPKTLSVDPSLMLW